MICIDPGHGGHDPGAENHKNQEKNIVLEISKIIEHYLIHDDREYMITRASDNFKSLSTRCSIADGYAADAYNLVDEADLFVSLHVNSFNENAARGSTIFHYPESEQGIELAEDINDEFINRPIPRRGVKACDDKPDDDTQKYMYVLANTDCPAVLVETGFLSNEHDRRYLTSHGGIYETAQSIYRGIEHHITGEDD